MDSLDPGQHIDFITMRIRNEGGGRVSFAKSHHAFVEVIQLDAGEAFLLHCTCPMVDKFVVLHREGETIRLLYKRLQETVDQRQLRVWKTATAYALPHMGAGGSAPISSPR